MPTCALCGGRDAATFTVLEFKVSVPACLICLAEPAEITTDVPYTEKVLAALARFDGVTLTDLADVLGYDPQDRKAASHTSQVLTRQVRAGRVRAEGPRNARIYYPKRPTAARRTA